MLSLVERNGRVRSFHIANVTAKSVGSVLARHASPKSRLLTDEAPLYKHLGWNFADHASVTHSRGEYVSRQDATIHTNTVEGYLSILKRGITGTFHHVSKAHLHCYLSEFDYRYNTRSKLGIKDEERASIALKSVVGKRLTYETLVSEGRLSREHCRLGGGECERDAKRWVILTNSHLSLKSEPAPCIVI